MKLKVYGGLTITNGKQVRTIVATTSQQKVAELTGLPVKYIRDYWSITGNNLELEIALASPNTVFKSEGLYDRDFKAV